MSGAGLALYCSATDEKNKQLFASSIKRRHWYTSDQFTYCIPKNYVIVCIVCKSICIFKPCIFSDSFLMVGKNESYLPVTRGSGSSPPTGGISCCSCFTCCTCINLSFLKVIIVITITFFVIIVITIAFFVIIVIIISCLTHCGYHRYQTKVLVTSALVSAMCHGSTDLGLYLHLPISV